MRIPKYMSVFAVLILLGASFVPVCVGKTTPEPDKYRKIIRRAILIPIGKLSIEWEGGFWTAWFRPKISFEPYPENEKIWINETIGPDECISFDITFQLDFLPTSPPLIPGLPENLTNIFYLLYVYIYSLRIYKGDTVVGYQPQKGVDGNKQDAVSVRVNASETFCQPTIIPYTVPFKYEVFAQTLFCHGKWSGNCTICYNIKEKRNISSSALHSKGSALVINDTPSITVVRPGSIYCGNVNIKWKTPLSPIVEAKVNDTELTVNLPEETADVIWNFICDSTFEPHNLPIIPAIGFYKVSLLEEERNVYASDWTYSYKWGSLGYDKGGIAIGSFTSQVHRNETLRWNVEIRAVAIPIYKSVVAHGEIVVHFV